MNDLIKDRWILDGGNEMRYKYALDEKSLVLDVGGYIGEFTSEINNRYGCEIHIIEPVKEFSDFLYERFSRFDNIEPHNVALCGHTGDVAVGVSKDASSIHQDFGVKQDTQCVRFSDFLSLINASFIDLIKINIEGEEYGLLNNMCVNGDVLKCDNIQVQFHDFIPDYELKYSEVKRMLSETHELTYYYPFLWENWRLKDKSYSQVGQDKWVLSQFPGGYRGFFLDLGCKWPREINNTLMLEQKGWDGLSVDIVDYTKEWAGRRTRYVCADALSCNYDELNIPRVIDYLSLDINAYPGARYDAMKMLIDNGFVFKYITIEHDSYLGYDDKEKNPQIELLKNSGYVADHGDVVYNGCSFEHWWVNERF